MVMDDSYPCLLRSFAFETEEPRRPANDSAVLIDSHRPSPAARPRKPGHARPGRAGRHRRPGRHRVGRPCAARLRQPSPLARPSMRRPAKPRRTSPPSRPWAPRSSPPAIGSPATDISGGRKKEEGETVVSGGKYICFDCKKEYT
jgi:hypothetical protein